MERSCSLRNLQESAGFSPFSKPWQPQYKFGQGPNKIDAMSACMNPHLATAHSHLGLVTWTAHCTLSQLSCFPKGGGYHRPEPGSSTREFPKIKELSLIFCSRPAGRSISKRGTRSMDMDLLGLTLCKHAVARLIQANVLGTPLDAVIFLPDLEAQDLQG